MDAVRKLLQGFVDDGSLPGAVAVVDRGGRSETVAVGRAGAGDAPPMTAGTLFRWASITKPVMAAGLLTLVDEGRIALGDPIARWLPELADPVVVRTPHSPVDDVVPAARPITVADVLTSQAGWGFPADFGLPAVRALFPVQRDGREVQSFPPAEEWLAELARLPLLYQPGESWLYDTSSALQGILAARVSGRTLPDFLRERLFAPLGMADTAFAVPAARRERFTSFYRTGPGGLVLDDAPDGRWSTVPALPLGSAGLVGTAADWVRFGRMLLSGGTTPGGTRVLSPESVRLMTTDHTTPAHREIGALFLEGQGWGMGGSVDRAEDDGRTPGRYGWVGGTGTAAHIVPSTGTVTVLLTQVGADSPEPASWITGFRRCTAGL